MDLIGKSIHRLDLKLSSHLAAIPECLLRHSNGRHLLFQVCIHQDPLGCNSNNNGLDYWLIRPNGTPATLQTTVPVSVLCLSPYGTIEQAQLAPSFKQTVSELLGRPVMAFVYENDVESLCNGLANATSPHRTPNDSPLLIRWSKLPVLVSTEESLNYDWFAFTLMGEPKPICIVRPLQIETCEGGGLVVPSSVLDQLRAYFKGAHDDLIERLEVSVHQGRVYLAEFYHHAISYLIKILSDCSTVNSVTGIIWETLGSNPIVQPWLGLLEYAGIVQSTYFKHYLESVVS
ncbi:hypothetical protein K501DRAFT_283970 [Backusella circina FSU 941]|nr:hypothetical protein K501DRAFT_283970 [Backusella circina FSU 941]